MNHHTDKKECLCEYFNEPHYHVRDNPHCTRIRWDCPTHGKQERHHLIHMEKEEYCVPCQKGCGCVGASQEAPLGEVEKLAEQLHIWYLEACKEKDAEFNPAAQKPYAELPEGSKFLDRYIAAKLVESFSRHKEEILALFPTEWCTDGEYTPEELRKAEGSIVKAVYERIRSK